MRRSWPKVLVLLLVVVAILAGVLGIRFWLGADELNATYAGIRERHPGDRMQSLLSCLQATDEPLAVKNRAIWILGELRDERALPILEELMTGRECDHQRHVCQRELTKAIEKIACGRELAIWRWVRDATTPCARAQDEHS
jgi:hypothetical protein